MRTHSQVLGVRTFTYEVWGDTIRPNTVGIIIPILQMPKEVKQLVQGHIATQC